ncbi:DnaJ domain-containing protein [Pseudoxanthomonas indica]|uniref:DnaJ domain-containing protein n=1 Tax=Pseudoxanthomonas indica TaxID=428993 RepID=A0A1T5J1X7_9GAMM|nr:DnaJ domain-containing protein [Pseudoxanthomonas indica]GGD55814.1 hypothetical protein GCM10007235_30250 [Pseudoxanthomonas indica]SKC45400.1 DnaJ domain-containing protein [Pseudoxanthomonas indica]
MSDDTDFIALYKELGLSAQCDLAEFKRAYRKRVTQLHPDHQGQDGDMPRLQRLNRMYDAALDFHREHARLPGAAPARPAPRPPGTPAHPGADLDDEGNFDPGNDTLAESGLAESGLAFASDERGSAIIDEAPPVTGKPRSRRYIMLMVLAVLLLYWWGAQKTANPSLDPEGPGDAVNPGLGAPTLAREVVVGMDEAQVRRILGAPIGVHDGRWDYGPSWVQFQCGQVVGWYSSPLHKLQVDEASLRTGAAAPHC